MSLKDRAIIAYKEEQEHKAKEKVHRLAKQLNAAEVAFEKRFGCVCQASLDINDKVFVAYDGLELRAIFTTSYSNAISAWRLRGTCPNCSAGCYSRSICSLADLGEQIAYFEPSLHKCVPTVHYPTMGEALLEALQNYIEEVSDE